MLVMMAITMVVLAMMAIIIGLIDNDGDVYNEHVGNNVDHNCHVGNDGDLN